MTDQEWKDQVRREMEAAEAEMNRAFADYQSGAAPKWKYDGAKERYQSASKKYTEVLHCLKGPNQD